MTLHTLDPDKKTLHGYFSPELKPAIKIESGDTVRFSTLDAGWGLEQFSATINGTRKQSPYHKKDPLKGHALTGPVAIKGAKAGGVLEVKIEHIRTGIFGWTFGGGASWRYYEGLGVSEPPGETLLWTLDPDAGTGTTHNGFTVPLAPFMGVMGLAPAKPGKHSTAPPRAVGGNIDCRELVAGSTLYLPIEVDGALFSVGDGHGAQGDGEVSGTAIECPMERVDLTFTARNDLHYSTPHAHTPVGWLTFGFHKTLDEAIVIALNAMLDLLVAQFGMSRKDALGMASVVVNMRITQIVNGVLGVHALLPHDIIGKQKSES